jgi:hypothetical protein
MFGKVTAPPPAGLFFAWPALHHSVKYGGQGGYDGNTDRHGSYGRLQAPLRSG